MGRPDGVGAVTRLSGRGNVPPMSWPSERFVINVDDSPSSLPSSR
ncbi:hypothetical protein HMPREF3223_02400 [Cutibacterium avidum]|nr:hypothetical protein HMPREF3223_02400 [Cutibacterium avidum]